MPDYSVSPTNTYTRDTSKDIYEEVSYDTTKPKFDVVTIENDVIFDFKNYGSSFNGMVFLTVSRALHYLSVNNITSGNTAPTIPSSGRQVWFDTTTNSIKMYAPNATEYEECCLALCLGTSIANTDFVLDQIFNGFGYIGSTIFALPGVKGLIPNGRNADGSLKNIEFTLNKVVLGTYANTLTTFGEPMLVGDNQGNITRIDYKNVYGKDYWHYEEAENKWYFAKNQKNWAEVGSAKWSSGVITSFTPKTTFHAVDYNNKSEISSWGMPSTRYIDLTLGASGATYTAPANGWVALAKKTSATNQYVFLSQSPNQTSSQCWCPLSGQYVQTYIPVRRGRKFTATYSAGGDTAFFKFIYSEGEN